MHGPKYVILLVQGFTVGDSISDPNRRTRAQHVLCLPAITAPSQCPRKGTAFLHSNTRTLDNVLISEK
jgi:hypothetical protein